MPVVRFINIRSNRNIPFDVGMGLVAYHLEVLEMVLVDGGWLAVDPQCWQRVGFSGNLQTHLVQVILVDVDIAASPNEFARFQSALLGQHHQQQCIAGQVKWQADKYIAGALIKLQMQPTITHHRLE